MRVLMIAPPGAGKGTQGALIAAHFGIPHIATGELLRDQVARQTDLGRAVQQHLERGELVPDEIVLDMVRQALVAAAAAGGRYVLDGIPRNMNQARATYLMAQELGMTANVALHLQVEDGELVRRAACPGRAGGSRRRHRGGHPPTTAGVPPDNPSHRRLVRRARHPGVGGCHASARTGWPEILAALEVMRPLVDHVPEEARRAVDLTSLGVAFGATPPASNTSG